MIKDDTLSRLLYLYIVSMDYRALTISDINAFYYLMITIKKVSD